MKDLPPNNIPKTLSQSIYNYLKESIINNTLKANQKIKDKEIAKLFDVSTTPVREAVLKLGAEGFVMINSHREALVREAFYEELTEIFQVLSLLDSVGASSAIDCIGPETMEELENLAEELESSCHDDSIEKFMAINQDFHKKIWECIPNRFLESTLQFINNQMLRYNYARLYAFKKPGALKRSLEEHKDIIEAIRNKDKKRLKKLIAKHWGSLLQASPFKEGLEEYLSNDRKEVKIEKGKKPKGTNKRSIARQGYSMEKELNERR